MSILNRETFLLRLTAGDPDQLGAIFASLPAEVAAICEKRGVDNLSVWHVDGLVFGYYEVTREYALTDSDKAALRAFADKLSALCEIIAEPFTRPMRLMYSDIGIVRDDKSLIRHRVFATRLKPGCADEYKRRHDALSASRGGVINEGPESDFTIWNAERYIFGYCELVRSFDHEMTANERQFTIAWETRGLEIMDWITDDVDWITGEKHSHISLVYRQK